MCSSKKTTSHNVFKTFPSPNRAWAGDSWLILQHSLKPSLEWYDYICIARISTFGLNRLMFCDTRYLLYFNMASGTDCAVAIPTSGTGGLVRPHYYEECLHRSEWVSEWHICISESQQETRFNASCLDEFKNDVRFDSRNDKVVNLTI